jgi:hypothetical protein
MLAQEKSLKRQDERVGALVYFLHKINERRGPAAHALLAAVIKFAAGQAAGEMLFGCPVAEQKKKMKTGERQHAPC